MGVGRVYSSLDFQKKSNNIKLPPTLGADMKKVLLATFLIFSATLSGCLSSDDTGEKLSDSDSDGVTDDFDAFPQNALEWSDLDGDGFGDNADAYPKDANESMDSDGDGFGDNRDAFPQNALEWSDLDGDGVGDNADAYPKDANESMDSDGDGFGDNADAFPQDSSEWADLDGDGVGDNGDAYPKDGNETGDSDGDGIGDDRDAFPQDSSEWADLDGDGVGDNGDLCYTPPLGDLFSYNQSVTEDGCFKYINEEWGAYPLINHGIYFSDVSTATGDWWDAASFNTSYRGVENYITPLFGDDLPSECEAHISGIITEMSLIPGNVSIDDGSPYPQEITAIGHILISLELRIGENWDYTNCSLPVENSHQEFWMSWDGPVLESIQWPLFSGIIVDAQELDPDSDYTSPSFFDHGDNEYYGEILVYELLSNDYSNSDQVFEVGDWQWLANDCWQQSHSFYPHQRTIGWEQLLDSLPYIGSW
jgi:hypothetical protein